MSVIAAVRCEKNIRVACHLTEQVDMEPLHVFRERRDPFKVYHTEEAFRQRYRLSRELVDQLATEFGHSQWSTKGTRHAKGLSHHERVGRKVYSCLYRVGV